MIRKRALGVLCAAACLCRKGCPVFLVLLSHWINPMVMNISIFNATIIFSAVLYFFGLQTLILDYGR